MASDPNQVLIPAPRRRIAPWLAVVALAAAGGLGYLSWTQHEELLIARGEVKTFRGEQRALSTSLEKQRLNKDSLGDQLATCRDELTTERTAVQANGERMSALETEMAACKSSVQNLEQAQAEARTKLEEFRSLTASFQKMIDAGQLDVEVRTGRMVVKLPDDVLFAPGKADVSDEGRVALGEVAVILKRMKDRRFAVAGHTDSRPLGKRDLFASNWELSTARAVAVLRVLIDKGVDPAALSAAGFAEHDPIAGNDTKAGRARNRRIEIALEPQLTNEIAKREQQPAAAAAPPVPE